MDEPQAATTVLAVARRFVDDCLLRGESLFTPGDAVWSAVNVAELYRRVVASPRSTPAGSDFVQKLRVFIDDAPGKVVQLAAEVLYLLLVTQDDSSAATKRANVESILASSEQPASLPPDLGAALARGIASYGAGTSQRPAQYAFLLEFARRWADCDTEERARLLADAAAFSEFVRSIPHAYASSQVEALLHLVFPKVFEPIVSVDIKRKITAAFAEHVTDSSGSLDDQLAEIRSELAEGYGDDFTFYDAAIRARWDRPAGSAAAVGKAWLVRGANNHGTNMLPTWFEHGFVSIGWPKPAQFAFDAPRETIKRALATSNPEWPDGQLARDAGIVARFLAIAPGELIVSPDGDDLYVARAMGGPEWDESSELACLRRPVEWLNRESPGSRSALKASSPALWTSLKSRLTVADISHARTTIARMAGVDEDDGSPTARWDEFVGWMARIRAWDGFDGMRASSLALAPRLEEVRELVEANDDGWLESLASTAPYVARKTAAHEIDGLVSWARLEPSRAAAALKALWEDGAIDDRVATFVAAPPDNSIGSVTAQARLASVLLLAHGAGRWPTFWVRSLRIAARLVDERFPASSAASLYARGVGFLEHVDSECRRRGVELGDLLDVEVAVWALAEGSDWAGSLDADGYRSWKAYLRGDGGQANSSEESAKLERLATDLHLGGTEWLSEVVTLVRERRQMIFYGPPGTGKTHIARRIATHLAESDDRVQLVQFHPSYAYEDFIQGYRPANDEKQPFSLRDGPLLRLAERAREDPDGTYVLVVDEINRGNIAKIFGELYFLLEYRDEKIGLQYGSGDGDEFALPANVLIIGTMNTSDRSIAVLDAAIRRRFAFVELSPRHEPVRGLLRRFMQAKQIDLMWLCGVLDAANTKLGEHEAGSMIGPSHFLKDDLNLTRVELIWRYDLMPLIEEIFFDRPSDAQVFALDHLRGLHDVPADENDAADDSGDELAGHAQTL